MIANKKTSALDDPALSLVNADSVRTVNKLLRADPKNSSEAVGTLPSASRVTLWIPSLLQCLYNNLLGPEIEADGP